jgi:hypothetical protein
LSLDATKASICQAGLISEILPGVESGHLRSIEKSISGAIICWNVMLLGSLVCAPLREQHSTGNHYIVSYDRVSHRAWVDR